jgi:hypothetical protein
MRLYHFTAQHHVDGGIGHPGPGILRTGLLANHHPLITLPTSVWLTEDGSFDQMWSTRPVPGSNCDRTEVRLTIEVEPNDRLLPYRVIRRYVRPDWLADFEGGFDLSPWWMQMGWIAPERILEVAARLSTEQGPPAVPFTDQPPAEGMRSRSLPLVTPSSSRLGAGRSGRRGR